MKTIKKLFSFLFCFILGLLCGVNECLGQRTDIVKYYIALDGSGSVPLIDQEKNLESLLDELVNVTGGQIKQSKSQAIFDVFIFGEKDVNSIDQKKSYGITERKVGRGEVIMNFIQRRMNQNSENIYSHIHTSLNEITEKVINGESITGGIFIFTDGKFQDGDFKLDTRDANFSSRSAYVAYVNSILSKLKVLSGKPVFMVQSSRTPYNPFISFEANKLDSIAKTKYYFDKKMFWIRNTEKFERNSDNEVKRAFRSFISSANDQITATDLQPTIPIPQDKIFTSITIQEILTALSYLRDDWNLVTDNALKLKLQRVDSLLGNQELKRSQVIELNGLITSLSKSINDVKAIKEKLVKDIASRDNTRLLSAAEAGGLRLIETYQGSEMKLGKETIRQIDKNSKSVESNIILGVTDFVIERAKDEAIFAFLENINTDILRKNPKLKNILPNVSRILDDSNYSFDLAVLKEAFKRDLKKSPENILKYADVRKSGGLVALYYFNIIYQQLLIDGSVQNAFKAIVENRISIPYQLANDDAVKVEEAMYFVAKLINYIEEHDLTSMVNGTNHVQFDKLATMVTVLALNDQLRYDTVKIQNAKKIIFSTYRNYLLVKEDIKKMQSLLSQPPTNDYDAYRKYQRQIAYDILWRAAMLTIEGFDLVDALLNKTDQRPFNYSKEELLRMANDCIEFYFLLKDEDYLQAAVILSPHLIKSILPDLKDAMNNNVKLKFRDVEFNNILTKLYKSDDLKTLNAKFKKSYMTKEQLANELTNEKLLFLNSFIIQDSGKFELNEQALNELAKKYKKAVDNGVIRAKEFFSGKELTDSILYCFSIPIEEKEKMFKILSVAGELSTTQSAAEVKTIISKYSLPVASFRIKRTRQNSLTLTSYAGVGTAFYTNGLIKPSIAGPIGVDFSIKLRKKENSFGFFASIVDIGNIIDYRLLGSSQDDGKDIVKFENIFSPGFFATLGTGKKLPLALGAGYQGNPSRFTLFLAFDIPVVNFWTSD